MDTTVGVPAAFRTGRPAETLMLRVTALARNGRTTTATDTLRVEDTAPVFQQEPSALYDGPRRAPSC